MPAELPIRRNCGTMQVHHRMLRSQPAYASRQAALEVHAQAYQQRSRARAGITVIPIVVHVVHHRDHPEQNISDEQVASQIEVLNHDYRAANPDTTSTPEVFRKLVADARVQFELAKIDPDGNPTNGITRTETTVDGFGDDDRVKSAASGGANPWPSDAYLNLWVCLLGGGLLGYAQFPGGPAPTDGVVITYTGFGTTGSAAEPFNLGRTATHEVGHWLNLRHIWGDDNSGCSGSDLVRDTPNQAGPNFGKPTFPHVTCDNAPNGDLFVNYMDYVDDAAMFMFTKGQVRRMHATLDQERSSIGRPLTESALVSLGAGSDAPATPA